MQDQGSANTIEGPAAPSDPVIPSRIKEEEWIKVYSHTHTVKSEDELENPTNSDSDDSSDEESKKLRGKWLLFHDNKLEVEEKGMTQHDIAWQFINELVEKGEMCAASCSTGWKGYYLKRFGKESGVICCYTKDYTDKRDVKRVADAIRRVYSYPKDLYYKTYNDTHAQVYRHLGDKCVSVYKHTVKNEMYERDLIIRNKWNKVEV
ncbi:uncharacterized protein TNIN_489211 [Trichonephila inaurata madagascariensis]|uniref:Uncharacterized protein n=1 Tax=Trichonephila inaurata madagascariensis TaxID=2747483 RepID=A0A8X6YAM7_9ARAC|nr:uncharacterized protein TNIN_489211 [Trichonephila inaurata madagascariensis]